MEIKILKKRKQRKRKKIQSQILNNLKNKKCHIMQLKFMITPILWPQNPQTFLKRFSYRLTVRRKILLFKVQKTWKTPKTCCLVKLKCMSTRITSPNASLLLWMEQFSYATRKTMLIWWFFLSLFSKSLISKLLILEYQQLLLFCHTIFTCDSNKMQSFLNVKPGTYFTFTFNSRTSSLTIAILSVRLTII